VTYAITAGAGTLVGAAVTALVLAPMWRARAYEAGWRKDVPASTGVVPVPPETVRRLAKEADSAQRRARRFELAVEALRQVHTEVVGDLLDTVAVQRAQLEPPAPHRSPVPVYGVHR
jgi:hypothetical protein